jgi:glutamine amidotransferase
LITIIDYGLGNIRSVSKALEFLGAQAQVSCSEEDIRAADGLILPGVGAFADGMRNLRERGLVDLLSSQVLEEKKPMLGICLGMQLMAEEGFENGSHKGLGWVHASVRKLDVGDPALKLPHIGWNNVSLTKKSPLFTGIGNDPSFYFVHSYHIVCDPDAVTSTCEYGTIFAASIQSDNIFGTQFHPEKSQKDGLMVLKNFVEVCGRK